MTGTLPIEDIISFEYDLTSFAFEYADYNGAVPIMSVEKDLVHFQLSNLTLNLTFDYAYVSDPPILADIGSAYIGIDTVSFDFDISSLLNDTGEFNITIKNIDLSFEDV